MAHDDIRARLAACEGEMRYLADQGREVEITKMEKQYARDVDALLRANEALAKALIGVTPSHRVKGRCWCPIAVDTGVTHSKACQAARAALAGAETGAEGGHE